MTHAELVVLAGVWLKRQRCGIVLMEHRGGYEEPDAIGWKRASESLLVECKVSVSDFRADRQKAGRTDPMRRLADRCYYMTPTGLLKVYPGGATYGDMLPQGWGLIETDGARFRVMVEAATLADIRRTDASYLNERGVLYRELRRYKAQGISYKPLTPTPPNVSQERQIHD